VGDGIEREAPLGDVSRVAADEASPGKRFRRNHPTRADPAIMMMADRSSFSCWVEPLADGERWMFLDPSGTTSVGPAYEREGSLDEIEAVLSRWRASGGSVENARDVGT